LIAAAPSLEGSGRTDGCVAIGLEGDVGFVGSVRCAGGADDAVVVEDRERGPLRRVGDWTRNDLYFRSDEALCFVSPRVITTRSPTARS